VPLQSANLSWNGSNAIVEASVDNSTWVTVTSGVNLTNIPAGFDPTNKALHVRVTFPGGLGEAYIEDLQFRAYESLTNAPLSGRAITYPASAMIWPDRNPALLRDDAGVTVRGGTLSIGTDATATVRTAEFWIKRNGTINYNAPLGSNQISIYTNGASGYTTEIGKWFQYVVTYSSDITTPMVIDGDFQISRFATYPTVLTATEVKRLYDNQVGIQKTVIDDGNGIQVTEPATSVSIYGQDWTTVSA
jgi:hypothetical protein